MIAPTVAVTSLRRYLRDRTALFFVVVLPVVVIAIVGATSQGWDEARVGVVATDAGPAADELVAALDRSDALAVTRFDSAEGAATAVRRSELAAAVVIPSSFEADLAGGDTIDVALMGDPASSSYLATRAAVASVVDHRGATLRAARFATDQAGGDFEQNLILAERLATDLQSADIPVTVIDTESGSLPEGFATSAPTMLVLFVFINSLAGGAAIIATRRLRIYERMAAAPIRRRSIIAGETLAYFAIAVLQSVIIVGVGAVLFGVDWGDPAAAGALIAMWALVGTGAGVLSGTLFRTPEQASSIGPPLGIAAGMLGGCMWPLEIVPPAMAAVGHLTPHAWAVDGWIIVLAQGGALADITGQLLVLAAFAAALLITSTVRLRRHLVA